MGGGGVTNFQTAYTAKWPGRVSALVMEGWADGTNGENCIMAVVILREGQLTPGLLATTGLGSGAESVYSIPENLWVSAIGRISGNNVALLKNNGANTGYDLQVGDIVAACWTGDGLGDVGCRLSFVFST